MQFVKGNLFSRRQMVAVFTVKTVFRGVTSSPYRLIQDNIVIHGDKGRQFILFFYHPGNKRMVNSLVRRQRPVQGHADQFYQRRLQVMQPGPGKAPRESLVLQQVPVHDIKYFINARVPVQVLAAAYFGAVTVKMFQVLPYYLQVPVIVLLFKIAVSHTQEVAHNRRAFCGGRTRAEYINCFH
ncbi:MAG: hypothetical protein BWY65_01966 [Firmicutes bacterium ADurb.Bin373]|nr:MAG: hypothetical protein BWY65_01966 [Firmicutes bacterium ADurb.Bin373]